MSLTCKDCGDVFERRAKFGRKPALCAECVRVRHNKSVRKWQSANIDRCREYNRDYQHRRYQNDAEFRQKMLDNSARYREEHRDEIRAKQNAYNAANPDRNSRIGKSWRERNPDKVKAYNARKKAEREAQRNANPGGAAGRATIQVSA